jgi:hypothetical protein
MRKEIPFLLALFFLFSTIMLAANAGDYYKYGSQLFKKGDYKKALSYYSEAAKLDPRNPEYYTAIASCYSKMGEKANAKKFAGYAESLSKHGMAAGAAAGAADKIKISAFTGFSTVSMSAVNTDLDTRYKNAVSAGGTGSKQDLGSGFLLGAQGGYSVLNGLYAGPRLEYIGVLSAKTSVSGSILGMTIATTSEYGGSLFDMLAGASYYYPLNGTQLTLSGDLYVGYTGLQEHQLTLSPLPPSPGQRRQSLKTPHTAAELLRLISV